MTNQHHTVTNSLDLYRTAALNYSSQL